jgi:hypothetical protein
LFPDRFFIQNDYHSWHYRPDKGQSDALNTGFAKASGDIFAWQNSDEIYLPGAFHTVASVFKENMLNKNMASRRQPLYRADIIGQFTGSLNFMNLCLRAVLGIHGTSF